MEEPLGAYIRRRERPDYAPRELVASSVRYTKDGKRAARAATES